MSTKTLIRFSGRIFGVGVGILLGGCATILNGGSQAIAVNTVPSGAFCTISRGGQAIATITETPAVVDVDRSRLPLAIRCDKPGYQPVIGTNASMASGVMFGNVIFGGLVGVIVDFSTGANYDYRTTVFIRFEKMPPFPPQRPG